MRRVKQRDVSDCGVACLAAIASHYDKRLSVARIRQLTGTDASGTTVYGLMQASRYLGFVARAVKAAPTELAQASFPAIAHVLVNERLLHYVVVAKLGRKRVTIMDPATGRFEKKSLAEFSKMWSGVLILMAPGVTFEPVDSRRSRLSWYAQLLKPHAPLLIQALCGALLSTLLALAGSFYIQKVVDSVLVESNTELLNLLTLGMFSALGFSVLLGVGQNLLLTRSGQVIDLTLILSYYRHLFTLPQTFFDGMRVGEMVSRINDAVKIRAFLNQQGANLIVSALTLVMAVAAMFVFSWKLALLSVGFLLVYSVLFKIAIWRNRLFSRRIMEQSADLDAQIVESLEMASTFRRFERAWIAEVKTESLLVKLLESTYASGIFAIAVNSFGSVLVQSFTIVMMWIGASAVIRTEMSPGQLISCFALTGYLTGPANNLLSVIVSALETQVAADRLFEILDLESEKDSGTIDLREIERLDVALDNVTFAYPGRLPILKGVRARFRPGEITLLRGESGCGKSSLLTLLQRFHAPSEGNIFFGDYEIGYLDAVSLRSQIAVVPQKIDLMSGTVTENITFCAAEPKMARILALCKKLGMLDFVEALPHGFETLLAENGKNLSGGQRQRIAIARALYVENALIYLFDEPTTALDEKSEGYFFEVLRELRDAGKIVILVSHDSRLIPFANRVYELKNGVIKLLAKAPAPPGKEIKLLPAPPTKTACGS